MSMERRSGKDVNEQLVDILHKLNRVQVSLLLEMARAMTVEIEQYIAENSDILVPSFNENFSNRLIIHHATHAEKFKKKAFEYAFASASNSAGRTATITMSSTNPGEDVVVDKIKFSLKTEASAKLTPRKSITISKLMEARWIRDCGGPEDFAKQTIQRVVAHLGKYERILMLRAYDILPPAVSQAVPVRQGSSPIQEQVTILPKIRYDLYEIPLNILVLVEGLKTSDFKPKTRNGGSSAKVFTEDGKHAFTITLDGSVEKVRISSLGTRFCYLHGCWIIPTIGLEADEEQPQTEEDRSDADGNH